MQKSKYILDFVSISLSNIQKQLNTTLSKSKYVDTYCIVVMYINSIHGTKASK